MIRIIRRKRCATCGKTDFTGWPRSFWMRWFKGSRHYQCRHCRTHLLLLDGDDGAEQEKASASWQKQDLS